MISYEDFIRKSEPEPTAEPEACLESAAGETLRGTEGEELGEEEGTELDVQKAVVEEFAAEKVEQEVKLAKLESEKTQLESEISELKTHLRNLLEENAELRKIKAGIDEMKSQLANVGEILARNSERPVSNQVAILDRNEEVLDRFEGETRDHILEILKDARSAAEADGRIRRAQLIEAVLAANEPSGNLAKRRQTLEKIFADNQYIINGQVINELDKLDIRYKDGENYLLAKEIIKRSY